MQIRFWKYLKIRFWEPVSEVHLKSLKLDHETKVHMCYLMFIWCWFDVYLLLLPFALNSIHPMPQERSASKLMVFSFTANISVKAVMRRLWGSELSGRGDPMRQMLDPSQKAPTVPQEGQKYETWSNRAANESTQSFLVHSAICPMAQWCLGMFRWETNELAWSGFAGWSLWIK